MQKQVKRNLYLTGWSIVFSFFAAFLFITVLSIFIWPIGLLMFVFNVLIAICVVGMYKSFIMVRRIMSGGLSLEQRIEQLESAINGNSEQ